VTKLKLILFLQLVFPVISHAQDDTEGVENKYFTQRWDTLSLVERNIPNDILKRQRQDKAYW